jgi:hypothetical protein
MPRILGGTGSLGRAVCRSHDLASCYARRRGDMRSEPVLDRQFGRGLVTKLVVSAEMITAWSLM